MIKPCPDPISGFIEKFKPNVWTRYDWGFFSNLNNYVAVLYYCFFVCAVDCNGFFLKFILWVPPDHDLLKVRLFIWGFSAIAATKEYYEFVTNKYCYRIGPFVWLSTLVLSLEFSIIIKFGSVMFTEPFPWYVKLMWSVLGLAIFSGGIYAYSN
jgi:phosphatidylserine synthase 2